jgi:hypothetical protein
MERRLFPGLIIALIVFTSSCSLGKGKGLGETAAVQFHNQFNAGKYKEIYDQADEGFRKAAKESDVIALFEAIRRKLGTVKQANQNGWGVNATPTGTTVTLQYNTQFTEGDAAEQFVFLVSGDKALLYTYNINSPLLITR